MQDPERHLTELGLRLPGAVDPNAQAVLSPDHRIRVNDQLFYVSSRERLRTFRRAPYVFTGPLRDPVDQSWFTPDRDSPVRESADGLYFFSSPSTAAAFDAER